MQSGILANRAHFCNGTNPVIAFASRIDFSFRWNSGAAGHTAIGRSHSKIGRNSPACRRAHSSPVPLVPSFRKYTHGLHRSRAYMCMRVSIYYTYNSLTEICENATVADKTRAGDGRARGKRTGSERGGGENIISTSVHDIDSWSISVA